MRKILLVLEREFLTRVRKKSFIIMTLLTPILFAGLMVTPALLMSIGDTNERHIAVIDDTSIFEGKLVDTEHLKFSFLEGTTVEELRGTLDKTNYYAVLHITPMVAASPDGVVLYSNVQPSIDITSYIASSLKNEIESQKLLTYNIENLDEILSNIKTTVRVRTIKWGKGGEAKESSTEMAMGISYILSFVVYMLVFLFGVQVMRGVIEEKSNRIVEVIVSSVKPFQLMMGKILGIAAVSFLQIVLWIVLTFGLVAVASSLLPTKVSETMAQETAITSVMDAVSEVQEVSVPAIEESLMSEIFQSFSNVNFGFIIGGFLFFFIFGYMLYAAMFAAVGSAVDNEADTQQMMLPMTIPLVLALFMMIGGLRSPDGSLMFWFSMIPFTSPITMVARLPYGVPMWELLLSGSILLATFVLFTWLAGKIFRTGILLYGKKHTWAEMWKWIRYSN